MVRDIPEATWVRIFASDPILRKEVLEGFSLKPGNSPECSTSLIMGRLRRKLQTDGNLFKKILAEWKEEQSAMSPISLC